MYRNIADEAISSGESASFIISQMTAFDIGAESAQHIIDAVYFLLAVWQGELTGTSLEPYIPNLYSNVQMA